jgi:hypothetical protein
VSVPFSSVAFSSSIILGRDLSRHWVVDSACSINLTAFRSDFSTFTPPSTRSRVGGVGVDVKGSGFVRMSIRLASRQAIHRTIHALYTPDLSSRSTQRIERLLSVSWLQYHCRCEFIFPTTDSDTGLLVVPIGVRVLEPFGNGLSLMPHRPELPPRTPAEKARDPCSRVALTAQCDIVLWHRRFGHLNGLTCEACKDIQSAIAYLLVLASRCIVLMYKVAICHSST